MRAPKEPVDLEPESTPTPPPFAVSIEDPSSKRLEIEALPKLVAPRRPWRAVAIGALLAVPLAAFVVRTAKPVALTDFHVAAEPSLIAAELEPLGAPVEATAEPSPEPRADASLNRDGRHYPLHGGVLFTPKTFASADGGYDLYLHFHGNTKVVLESAEVAGVNAFVAVINLGVGSAPYEHDYLQPGQYAKLLAEIQHGAEERGLAHPHLRRIALGSWSAGYGAIGSILRQDHAHEHLDAILVLDGIHVGWIDDERTQLNALNLGPFIDAAKAAARGDFLFSITHSDIVPEDYASSTATADLLLDAVNAGRHPVDERAWPTDLALESAKNAVSKKLEKHMEPVSEATVGSFHVRGYRGNTPEHHMAHLLQMGATVMPELAARWERAPATP